MALTVDKFQERKITAGGNGYTEVTGVASFTTTDATGELPARFNNIENVQLTAIGTPAADEVLSVNETVVNGVVKRPTSGTLTIARTGAAKTSGLKFFFSYRGF